MEMTMGLVGMLAAVGIFVGVPLAMLRSLEEIKAGQRRLEARMVALEAHLGTPDRVG